MKLQKWLVFLIILFLLVGCEGNREKERAKYFSRGEKFLREGNYARAEVEFRNAIRLDPRFALAYYGLGEVYFREGRLQAAYGAFLRAVELAPDLIPVRVALGRLLLAARQGKKALEQAEYVLSKNPNHTAALLLKAAALLSLGESQKALDLLRPLCEEKQISACVLLSEAYLKSGQREEAERSLRTVLKEKPHHPQATLLLAGLLESEKRYQEAEKLYVSLVESYPQKVAYLKVLVRFYERRKAFPKAIEVLRRAVSHGLENEKMYLLLAECYALSGRDKDFEEALKEGLKRFPESLALLERLTLYYAKKGENQKAHLLLEEYLKRVKKRPLLLRAELFRAALLKGEGRLDEALRQLEEILRESPHFMKAHLMKGDILLLRKDYLGAIAEYRAALGEEPQNPKIMLRLARAHFLNQELDLAEDVYKRVLEIDPGNRQAYLGLAEVYLKKGRLEQARATLEENLKRNPGDLEALEKLIDLYLQEKDLASVRRVLKRTLALQPRHPAVLTVLARILRKAGLIEEMIPYCEKLNAQHPRPFYLLLLAELYGETGNYSKAISFYRRVLRLDPQNQIAANNLAFYLAQYKPTPKNLAEAEKLLFPGLQRFSSQPELIDTLAWIKYRRGAYNEARVLLENLGKKVKQNSVISFHLGAVYYRLGEKEKALSYLKSALRGGEDFPGRKEAEKILAELMHNHQ